MNSPFGKLMAGKNPISALQQNAFQAARIDAIKNDKDTFKVGDETFRVEGDTSGIKMHGPLHKHGKLEKQLEILKNDPELAVKKGLSTEGQGGKDYEAIAALEKKIKEAKEAHKNKSDERPEEDNAQVREDEDAARGAAVEMHTPFHNYGGYTGGGMSKDDYASTADLFQNLQDKVAAGTIDYHDRRDKTGKYAVNLDKDKDKDE